MFDTHAFCAHGGGGEGVGGIWQCTVVLDDVGVGGKGEGQRIVSC